MANKEVKKSVEEITVDEIIVDEAGTEEKVIEETIVEEKIVDEKAEKPAKAKRSRKPRERAKKAEVKEVIKEVEIIKEVEVVKVVTPQIFLQYDGIEIDATTLVDQALAQCSIGENCTVESIRIYVKPADDAAYYVVNEIETGKIDLK